MPYRYVCSVLQELREYMDHFCNSVSPADFYSEDEGIMEQARFVRRRAHIFALIEEVQTLVNRMEAALEVEFDIRAREETAKELKEQNKQLRNDIKENEKILQDLVEQIQALDDEYEWEETEVEEEEEAEAEECRDEEGDFDYRRWLRSADED